MLRSFALILAALFVMCSTLLPLSFGQAANSSPDELEFREAMAWADASTDKGIQRLEAFLNQYPNSYGRERAFERLIDLYTDAAREGDVRSTAERLLKEFPNNVKGKQNLHAIVIDFRTTSINKDGKFGDQKPDNRNEQRTTEQTDSAGQPKTGSPTLEQQSNTSAQTSSNQKAGTEKTIPPAKPPESGRETPDNQSEQENRSRQKTQSTNIVVALIGAFAAILAAYWRFVYKPKRESAASSTSGHSVSQSPVINVSPNINVSVGNVDRSHPDDHRK
jgi:hypothetical protein